MNKIKLMLTAVVVLSTVGGVLAFKATRVDTICTAATKASGTGQGTCGNGTPGNPFVNCAGSIQNRQLSNSGTLVCTQTVDPVLQCNIVCPVRTRTTGN